jgi:aerobic-type carbon monoxide dehydrogenase small subunit (CoxS/CutS family)
VLRVAEAEHALLRARLLLVAPRAAERCVEPVLADGVEIRSCQTPIADVGARAITTLEGLPALYAQQKKLAKAPDLHPLSQAFIDQQAMHCGYCYNGQTIKGAELLAKNPNASEAQIRAHMDGHICRCGTYPRILASIQAAGAKMQKEG